LKQHSSKFPSTITTRAGGRTNIRSDPSTTARVVTVVGPGTVLGVFGEARNGWLPVGRDAPLGWVRQTTLDR
jgi:SH3-like domain-containing protein